MCFENKKPKKHPAKAPVKGGAINAAKYRFSEAALGVTLLKVPVPRKIQKISPAAKMHIGRRLIKVFWVLKFSAACSVPKTTTAAINVPAEFIALPPNKKRRKKTLKNRYIILIQSLDNKWLIC